MKNVTVTLPEGIALWARVWAAKNNASVSKMLREMLEERMQEEIGYEQAKHMLFSRKPVSLKISGDYPPREQLHER